MPRFLLSSLRFDRAAIMRAAWVEAHAEVLACSRTHGPFRGCPITLRAAFNEALRHVWSLARAERSHAEWAAEQDAEAAQLATLPVEARRIAAARTALLIAEHADTFTAASTAAVLAARAQLASLQA